MPRPSQQCSTGDEPVAKGVFLGSADSAHIKQSRSNSGLGLSQVSGKSFLNLSSVSLTGGGALPNYSRYAPTRVGKEFEFKTFMQ